MTNADIKKYLNNTVYYKNKPYKLNGATIRKNESKFYYQCELQDNYCPYSVFVVNMEGVDAEPTELENGSNAIEP